ncbi:MAG: VOC family protein [Rhizobiaceae bacterium]
MAGNTPHKARAVDHLVLPVESLAASRRRYEQLGFSVARDAIHPFGTENACVFFKDGTYLEPLAIEKRGKCEDAARRGNVFVARDQAYRFRKGANGFSAISFRSADAAKDHKHFVKLGMSAGKILKFGRIFDDGKGNKARGEFRLAFAGDLRAPDCFFFTCERLNVPAVDRSALEKHANGAVSMKEIALSEVNPTDFQYLLQEVTGEREVNAHSFGMEIRTANANIAAYTAAGMKAWFGNSTGCGHGRGLQAKAIVLGVRDVSKTRSILEMNGVSFRMTGDRIVVDPDAGQGAMIAFEAAK